MRLATLAILAGAGLGLVACDTPQHTAGATPHHYQDPTTGSLLSGGDSSGLSNGFNDPGMNSRNHTAGGH